MNNSNLKQERVECAACFHMAPPDRQWPTLCMQCAGKIRAIDKKASDVTDIRREMREMGIPSGTNTNRSTRRTE